MRENQGALPQLRQCHQSVPFVSFAPAPTQESCANQVRDKTSLGFTNVTATEESHPRTLKFFFSTAPRISDRMGTTWKQNEAVHVDYARGTINLAQLYNLIGCLTSGSWIDYE